MTGSNKMKPDIAIVHRYFWPQNYPYAIMLKGIAEGMSKSGMNVLVCSCHEKQTDQLLQRKVWASERGVACKSLAMPSERTFSIPMKIFSALYYAVWVFSVALFSGAKVIWVGSTPPVIMPLLLRFARCFRRFKIVYHCQDIHPESMSINGNLKRQWVYDSLRKIDAANVVKSDLVLTLSADMKDTIASRPCEVDNVKVINNFILDEIPVLREPVKRADGAPYKLLFAGGLGRFQNLEVLTQLAIELAKKNLAVVTFMGDGPVRSIMERMVRENGLQDEITFLGHRPLSDAIKAMQAADFGLVSLTPGVDKVAYPSKTIMYLAAGLPCLAFVSHSSSLGRMLKENNLGAAFDLEDTVSLFSQVEGFLSSYAHEVMGRNEIMRFAQDRFSEKSVVSMLVGEVKELIH
ncbi:hypothetical protein A3730_02880 [Alcanivorax sp. HI0044]|nr:hypothetical protein A3730_02880 [Alcanivorax sp. HI0044]